MEESSNHRRCNLAFFCGRTGLFLLMTGYALFGALLFKALEGSGHEIGVSTQVQRSREDCLRELWIITERLNVLYEKNWTRLVTEQLKRFERVVVESSKQESANWSETPPNWTFGGALLYTLTLLTTIGYGRLAPRTALGKLAAVLYALIGVPLMLVLLSALGAMLAAGLQRGYAHLTCHRRRHTEKSPTVGYHKAPTSPGGRYAKYDDSATIQIQDVPKRALLATVRSSRARGACRQSQVRQLLAETTFCNAHGQQPPSGEIEEAEEPDEQTHDTPSRVPLICSTKQQPHPTLPPVPTLYVLFIFFTYIGAGAAIFVAISGWSVLDAIYFCFIALSTIGIGDKLADGRTREPNSAQFELFACCLYVFIGLVVVAMCFSLLQEEIYSKCRHFAQNIGLVRH